MNAKTKFKDVKIGQKFDFVSANRMLNSFYLRCEKLSPRKYKDERGIVHVVGSVNCNVYNVD